jgi:hypothetical protein
MKNGLIKLASLLSIFFILFFSLQLSAQVQRGKLYVEGDSLYAIRSGIYLKIPEGWKGGVLQDTRVLTLVKVKPSDDQIYVLANIDATIEDIENTWNEGIDLGYGLSLKPKNQVIAKEQSVSAEFVSDNTKSGKRRTFGFGKCGPFQVCVTAFVSGPDSFGDENFDALNRLIESVTFVAPQPEASEEYVDWSEFFKNKYVYAFETSKRNKKINQIWFCDDGTFTSKLTRRGKLSDKPNKHMLKKKRGSWTVSGKGANGELTINFDDQRVPEFSVIVEMMDGKLFINGNRHYRNVIRECLE